MTVREWQQLTPAAAAREVHSRVRTRLAPAQQRAAVSWLANERTLELAFAAAPRSADHPLGAVPMFAKDVFDVTGVATFAGSTFLPEVRPTPPQDSRLIQATRSVGMVCAGKTHLHEFAYGITGENPHYGDCEHPRFPGRTTGGSSSGSAAAVAADVVPVAFGTDTGGSIRVPAAFCGLYGFRLTPRDSWIRDAFPLAPSFDTAGWFTGCATDMRHTIKTLVGLRHHGRPLQGCFLEMPGLDPEVAAAFQIAASRFAAPVDQATGEDLLEGFSAAPAAYNTTVAVEAWEVHHEWAERFGPRYDPHVWERLNRIRSITPADRRAAEVDRARIRLLWAKFFLTYDFLVMPATPFPALTKEQCTPENRARILALTTPASIGGLPVLTLPVALDSGLSTGLQIIVNHPQSPVIQSSLTLAEEDALDIAA
jgi:amidase/aspartyl-tRNA(Asn)/glutamyl-tRNA(Gln) amidotransferase subunit A